MSTLITGGRIVTAVDDYTADILIDGETISMIGSRLNVAADYTLDATGNYVLPGGVDPHVHLEMPFAGTATADTFTSGTMAAASGGTTTIVDFPLQRRGQELQAVLDEWFAKLDANRPFIDVGFHMILTDVPQTRIGEIDRLIEQGITSFKLFLAYKSSLMVDDEMAFRILRQAGESGALVMVHAENGGVIDALVADALRRGQTGPRFHALTRPSLAEAEATYRAIAIAEIANSAVYIVHLSCAEALNHVQAARRRGAAVYAETCPQYLFLDDSVYDLGGFASAKYVFTPPARAQHHQDALWRGLALGDLSVISTDHCPFCFKGQKDLGANDFSKIPNGAPGIENRLSMVHTGGVIGGRITLNRMVDLLSTTPAKLFGLFPRKGTVAVGSDADLVIFDPAERKTIRAANQFSKVDYNLFEGREVIGVPKFVLCRGKVVFDNGSITASPGHGRFVKRQPHLLRSTAAPPREVSLGAV